MPGVGAGDGNRTHVSSLGSCSSTIELHPHRWRFYGPPVAVGKCAAQPPGGRAARSEEHTSELKSPCNLVCRLLLEKKKKKLISSYIVRSSIIGYSSLAMRHLFAARSLCIA